MCLASVCDVPYVPHVQGLPAADRFELTEGATSMSDGTNTSSDTQPETAQPDDLETHGTGEAAKRIGQAYTTTDVLDPERSSRNTAAGTGSDPGEGRVHPDSDFDLDPDASIEPHNEGLV